MLIVFGLWGGALADRLDRRMIMVVTGSLNTLLSAALLVNALLDRPQVWVVYLVAGLLAMSSSLQRPSQDALVPRTVRPDQLTAAVATWSLAWQLGGLVGPAIGGVLITPYANGSVAPPAPDDCWEVGAGSNPHQVPRRRRGAEPTGRD